MHEPSKYESSILGTVARFPLKFIPRETELRVIKGPIKGKKWISGSSNHGCWLGTYELKKQKEFVAAVKPGGVVYDLGAHVGYYTLLASALVGPEGQVFAFEPLAKNLNYLRRHLEMNAIANCSVWDVAVGREEGVAGFDCDTGVHNFEGQLVYDAPGDFETRVVAIDPLVNSGKLPPPDVIKCDIEGAEYDAFVGASETLAKYGPTILLATHGPLVHQQCCEFLSALGYKLSSLDERPLAQTNELIATRNRS